MMIIKESTELKEGKLKEFINDDFNRLFDDGTKPLIFSEDNYDVVVYQEHKNGPYQVLIEAEYYEYYKNFKTKKGAVKYAETIINQIDKYDSATDAAIALGFNKNE